MKTINKVGQAGGENVKKLINTCRAIQTVSAVVASIAIIFLATAYEPTVNRFIIMGFVFLVSVIFAAFMTLVIDVANDSIKKKEVIQEKSCRSFYDCRYNNKGFYVNERRISIASKDSRRI